MRIDGPHGNGSNCEAMETDADHGTDGYWKSLDTMEMEEACQLSCTSVLKLITRINLVLGEIIAHWRPARKYLERETELN